MVRRRRRRGERPIVRLLGRAVKLAVVALVVFWALAPLRLSNWRSPVVERPIEHGLAYEVVDFQPRDHPIRLRAWWIPAEPAKAALVMVHGGGDNKSHPHTRWLELARGLVDGG